MARRGVSVTVSVGVLLLMALFIGCFGEEDEKPSPDPKAVLSGPGEAWVGDLLEFDASASRDGETEFDALDFRWDMGDGTIYKGKPFVSQWIAAINHTYLLEGTYLINLTVSDAWGNEGLANLTVMVRYQLNMTINARGTWISTDALNNTTYYNLTIRNEWVDRFDLPIIRIRMLNETGAEVAPMAVTGEAIPANLTTGEGFNFQMHFRPPVDFVPVSVYLCEQLRLDP